MKENSTIETQLESWKPLDPSARVKAAVFGGAPVAERQLRRTREPRLQRRVSPMVWMTPAACALMIGLFMRVPHGAAVEDFGLVNGSNLVASLSSNLVKATQGGKEYQSQNVWHEVTFEWTRAPKSASSIGSFAVGNTNSQTP